MNRDEFIRLYVIQFCASFTAVHYTENCIHGRYDATENPPVEDAIHLAEKAWIQVCQHGVKYF